MNNKRPKAKRVIRQLTAAETKRLIRARKETEASRDEILREGRVAKQAWIAMRRTVEDTVRQLRAERERLGLSLADIEQRCGLRPAVVSRLENDPKSNPTLLTLQRYANALELTVCTTVQGRST